MKRKAEGIWRWRRPHGSDVEVTDASLLREAAVSRRQCGSTTRLGGPDSPMAVKPEVSGCAMSICISDKEKTVYCLGTRQSFGLKPGFKFWLYKP